MKYKLIASDMDGTLLNSASQLTVRTKAAIVAAVDAGAMFVTATGRPFCNVGIVNDILAKDMPFIIFNGSAAYMGKSEKLLFEKFLDFELALEAFELGQQFGFAQIIWTGPRLWCNRVCDETVYYRDFSTVGAMTEVTDLEVVRAQVKGISKVLWMASPDVIKEKQSEMIEHYQGRLGCYSSLPPYLEFVSSEAGKGAALAEVGRLFGVDKSEMLAVGDAYNDVSMLEYAGFSVAMANAPDDIKAICDYVTVSNDEDGVAEVIERFVL